MKGVLTMKKVYETPEITKTEFESYEFITLSIPEIDSYGIEDYGEA